jgi:hypothetical protein
VEKSFYKEDSRYRIEGLVRDAMYSRMREPLLPTAYVPFQSVDERMCALICWKFLQGHFP